MLRGDTNDDEIKEQNIRNIILLPLSIFGGFSIYQTNRKIDDMTECNLATVSENQRINIKNFCEDRKSEMEMIANYAKTQAAIKESV